MTTTPYLLGGYTLPPQHFMLYSCCTAIELSRELPPDLPVCCVTCTTLFTRMLPPLIHNGHAKLYLLFNAFFWCEPLPGTIRTSCTYSLRYIHTTCFRHSSVTVQLRLLYAELLVGQVPFYLVILRTRSSLCLLKPTTIG